MLVLSRKVGESLIIGEIEIKVTEVSGDHVKLGIQAPKHLKILRKELCQTVESNIEAANVARPTPAMLDFFAKFGKEDTEKQK